jgi:hypothetical protein
MITILKDGTMTRMPGDKPSPYDDWELLYNKACRDRAELQAQRDALLAAANEVINDVAMNGEPLTSSLNHLRAAIAAAESKEQVSA